MDHLEMWWITWRCGGSLGDMVDHLEIWWITWRCVRSLGDVVGYLKMWWITWRCGVKQLLCSIRFKENPKSLNSFP